MAKVTAEWSQHLTQELREHFERVGAELVSYDVREHRYSKQENHFAALAWLAEQREKTDARDRTRYRWVIAVATATLIVTCVGAYFAYRALPG